MNRKPDPTLFEKAINQNSSAGRRSFLGVLIGLIWAGITGTIVGVAARFVTLPMPAAAAPAGWTDVGPLRDIPEGKPTKRTIIVPQNSGWARFNSQRLVWVIRRGSNVTVFTAVCPHLGGTVAADANGFGCLCHGSSWNVSGGRLGGPTTRGLDLLESRVDGDLLKVRYQDFKQGTSEKQAV